MSSDGEPSDVDWGAVAGWAIVLSIVALLGMTAAGGWPSTWIFLSSSAAASWVQAFGSIAAVCGAVWVMDAQHRRERTRSREQERITKRVSLLALLALFTYAARACRHARKLAPGPGPHWPMQTELLRSCRVRLLSIPAMDIPSISLQIAVSEVADRLLLAAEAALHAQADDSDSEIINSFFRQSQTICLAGASEVHEQLLLVSTKHELDSEETDFPALKARFDLFTSKNSEMLAHAEAIAAKSSK